ncbi:MAG: M23 family metallopeptidase [Gammaproteobacteria bacterium]|nr:M23 family metallopeptidase [Gammaproteobacteria bacterium]MBV8402920.1 M23 family metallopeptidase [Gammaproteobacteria bacterium]
MRAIVRTLFLLLLAPALVQAQSIHAYKDANGQWVFTDRGASTGDAQGNAVSLSRTPEKLRVVVERTDAGKTTRLTAVNDCLCVVTLRVAIGRSSIPDIAGGTIYPATLEPGSREILVEAQHSGDARPKLEYAWSVALGSPDAEHKPTRPYRAPFALGTTYRVSQAYPAQFTHTTPDSIYAIDIALPDGTAVYAARAGTIINVRHDGFRGGTVGVMADQANLIEILHDDGTIAVYGHLHWDSIRVHIGQHVALGEYIADSGNTGFSSGPHLHFAVWRNAGDADVSLPVQFAGPSGTALTPVTGMELTAY